jgi:DNA polymerase III delta prime subunit
VSRIIAFSGPAGAGKSTAAKILAERHGYEHAMFAGALKAMFRTYLEYRSIGRMSQWTVERMIEGDLKEVPQKALCGRTPRQFMVWLGTEFGRDLIHPDFWVETERARLKTHNEKVVYCGLRFPNEAAMVREMGGIVIRVEGRGIETTAMNHESELHYVEPDLVIHNNKSIEDLADRLATVLACRPPRS